MNRFVRDTIVFLAINGLLLGYLYWIYDVPKDYLASLNDTLDRLEQKEPPRILFIGGSATAWSNHTDMVKETFGMEAENVALHAGHAFSMRLEEARQIPRDGDIVVISTEWSIFKDEPWTRKMSETFLACPRSIQYMNVRDRKLVLDGMMAAMRVPVAAALEDAKRNGLQALTRESAQKRKQWRLREKFSELGDFQGHYGQEPIGIKGKVVSFATPEQMDEGIERLNELKAELWERGVQNVQLFYFIPVIPQSRYDQHKEIIDRYVVKFQKQLEFPVLNPDHIVFPDEDYFDSCYHLQDEPGQIRTQYLIDGLKKHIKSL